jgi:glycosyltransferase involved in cell wall biosynthesis
MKSTAAPPHPPLVVVAVACRPDAGSESGKGWNWVRALAREFEIHLIATPEDRRLCLAHPEGRDWKIHLPDYEIATWEFPHGYVHYHRWCQSVLPLCRRVAAETGAVGLWHVTLGSFRFLPRYDRLGMPFVIGPVGGGEFAPSRMLAGWGMPARDLLAEYARPLANKFFAARPAVRRVFSKAALTVATTQETAALLCAVGARETVVKFPDVFDPEIAPTIVGARRAAQRGELAKEIRLVWSGRILWWKGPHIALRFLRRLRAAGVSARLDIYGAPVRRDFAAQLRALCEAPDARDFAAMRDVVSRSELQEVYLRSHLFVYPTLHDSSSSAIPEAYAAGLPSFTPGLGGTAVACVADAGLNESAKSVDAWLDAGVALVRRWVADPDEWLRASRAALQRSSEFGLDGISGFIREVGGRAFSPGTAAGR